MFSPAESQTNASLSLSRSLAVGLAVAAIYENKDAILTAALSDPEHRVAIERDLDFQRAYQLSRDKKINLDAVRAADAADLSWYGKDRKFNANAWLQCHH